MNFHTFELSYKLSTDDVRIVYNELYNASGQNYKPKDVQFSKHYKITVS